MIIVLGAPSRLFILVALSFGIINSIYRIGACFFSNEDACIMASIFGFLQLFIMAAIQVQWVRKILEIRLNLNRISWETIIVGFIVLFLAVALTIFFVRYQFKTVATPEGTQHPSAEPTN